MSRSDHGGRIMPAWVGTSSSTSSRTVLARCTWALRTTWFAAWLSIAPGLVQNSRDDTRSTGLSSLRPLRVPETPSIARNRSSDGRARNGSRLWRNTIPTGRISLRTGQRPLGRDDGDSSPPPLRGSARNDSSVDLRRSARNDNQQRVSVPRSERRARCVPDFTHPAARTVPSNRLARRPHGPRRRSPGASSARGDRGTTSAPDATASPAKTFRRPESRTSRSSASRALPTGRVASCFT